MEIPWNDGWFRAEPGGTMLLMRFWGIDLCFFPRFMRLRCNSILCENSATPRLNRLDEPNRAAANFGWSYNEAKTVYDSLLFPAQCIADLERIKRFSIRIRPERP